jgi:hypothetical protein
MGKRATCSADKGWSIGIRQRAKGTPKKFSVGIFKLSVSTGFLKPHAFGLLRYCVPRHRAAWPYVMQSTHQKVAARYIL